MHANPLVCMFILYLSILILNKWIPHCYGNTTTVIKVKFHSLCVYNLEVCGRAINGWPTDRETTTSNTWSILSKARHRRSSWSSTAFRLLLQSSWSHLATGSYGNWDERVRLIMHNSPSPKHNSCARPIVILSLMSHLRTHSRTDRLQCSQSSLARMDKQHNTIWKNMSSEGTGSQQHIDNITHKLPIGL